MNYGDWTITPPQSPPDTKVENQLNKVKEYKRKSKNRLEQLVIPNQNKTTKQFHMGRKRSSNGIGNDSVLAKTSQRVAKNNLHLFEKERDLVENNEGQIEDKIGNQIKNNNGKELEPSSKHGSLRTRKTLHSDRPNDFKKRLRQKKIISDLEKKEKIISNLEEKPNKGKLLKMNKTKRKRDSTSPNKSESPSKSLKSSQSKSVSLAKEQNFASKNGHNTGKNHKFEGVNPPKKMVEKANSVSNRVKKVASKFTMGDSERNGISSDKKIMNDGSISANSHNRKFTLINLKKNKRPIQTPNDLNDKMDLEFGTGNNLASSKSVKSINIRRIPKLAAFRKKALLRQQQEERKSERGELLDSSNLM